MTRGEARAKAEKLVAEMSIEEKISQLVYESPKIEHLGIPEYNWWNEALHGVARAGRATVFPQPIGMAASFDDELLFEVASAISIEARAKYNENVKHSDRDIYKGITMWSPNINIFRDPRWGRGHETYGEDPYLTSRMGCAFVKGLQGDGEFYRTAACAKHLACHSGPEEIRHSFDAKMTKKDLFETYLPAFEAVVKEGKVEAVMGAYNRVNGELCCASPTLMHILRDEWGFEGHFVSDCGAIQDFWQFHKVASDFAHSAALALNAGLDMNCGCSYRHLGEALEKGLTDEERITESCIRVFTARYLLGMFEEKEPYQDIPYSVIECREHQRLNLKMAHESMVLLSNNGILPLDTTRLKSVAIIGPNADSRVPLWGNYHGTASRWVTVMEALSADLAEHGIDTIYAEGCDIIHEEVEEGARAGDRLSEALSAAEHSDAVVLVLGLDERYGGETTDVKSYALPEPQLKLYEAVRSTGKPVVVVILSGCAHDLRFLSDADAVLYGWYPGSLGGKAVSDILIGLVSPSGKLPLTFYEKEEDIPPSDDYSITEGRTYRYVKTPVLYPFGFGLTYTHLSIDNMIVEDRSVSVDVTNDGSVDSDDVIELYIRDAQSEDAPLHAALKAFRRVQLAKGERKKVSFKLRDRDLMNIDAEGRFSKGSGFYEIAIGNCQCDERSLSLGGFGVKKCVEIH